MGLKIKLWGIRGSLPTPKSPEDITKRIIARVAEFNDSKLPLSEFLEELEDAPRYKLGGYGGHTFCVQVQSEKSEIIIDGGSGIRQYGAELLAGPCGQGKGVVHIFFTHFHWDHLIGLPFFVPLFIPGNEIHFHAVQDDLEDMPRYIFKKPYFPVPFEQLGANFHFHKLKPREANMIGDISVTPYQLDHPDPCWGFKVSSGGVTYSHCVDTEAIRVSRKDLGEDLPLYQDVDLMLFDAQYTFQESIEKIDWGHSSSLIGLDLAMREKVKRILFVHHDPSASDEDIYEAFSQTKEYYNSYLDNQKQTGVAPSSVNWAFANEGMVINLHQKELDNNSELVRKFKQYINDYKASLCFGSLYFWDLNAKETSPGERTLLIGDGQTEEVVISQLVKTGADHVIQMGQMAMPEHLEMISLVLEAGKGAVEPVRLLETLMNRKAKADWSTFKFTRFENKEEILSKVDFLLAKLNPKCIVRSEVMSAVDEMLLNALMHASGLKNELSDDAGIDDLKALSTELREGTLHFVFNDSYLAICCEDGYGTLDVNAFLSRVVATYQNSDGKMVPIQDGMGAGLGGRIIFQSASSLILGVEPNSKTYMIGLWPLGISRKSASSIPKSLHVIA